MTTLTNLETKVLAAFNVNYDTAEMEKSDNASYATVAGIAKDAGMEVSSVRGVIGSLTVKGLIWQPEADQVSTLTNAGVDAFFSITKAEENTNDSDDWEPMSEEDSEQAIQEELKALRNKQSRPVWNV